MTGTDMNNLTKKDFERLNETNVTTHRSETIVVTVNSFTDEDQMKKTIERLRRELELAGFQFEMDIPDTTLKLTKKEVATLKEATHAYITNPDNTESKRRTLRKINRML